MEKRPGEVEGITDSILVVGGGFIGGSFANYAAGKGHEVTVISLSGKESTQRNITCLQCDIREKHQLQTTLKDYDFSYVFNASGYIDHSPLSQGGLDVISQHYSSVLNLLESLDKSKLKKFLQLGSSDEYGNAPAPQSEDQRESPISPYSFGKLAATHLLQMLYQSEEFPAVIVRPFLVYGPRQNSQRLLPYIIQKCINDEEFDVSEGKQRRDYCFIDDFIEGAYLSLLSEKTTGQVLNLASGIPVCIRDVIHKVTVLVGGGKPRFGALPHRNNENMELYASIEKARTLIGWSPGTALDSGLNKTIQFYRAQND